jgi:phosphatidylserine/phosphatidylglycerophosphate/cardiolipin synthase-like enzyme
MKRNIRATAVLVVFAILISTGSAADMVVQACFSPQARCSAHILREIELAKKELLIAVYAFTSDELATALVQAKKRGLVVQVVVDREFDLTNENSKAKFFDAQKIPVRRVSGMRGINNQKEAGLMHQKFAVIDSRIIFTGSYNWTYSADKLNDENLLFFRDAGPLAEEYRKAFFRLWERKF